MWCTSCFEVQKQPSYFRLPLYLRAGGVGCRQQVGIPSGYLEMIEIIKDISYLLMLVILPYLITFIIIMTIGQFFKIKQVLALNVHGALRYSCVIFWKQTAFP